MEKPGSMNYNTIYDGWRHFLNESDESLEIQVIIEQELKNYHALLERSPNLDNPENQQKDSLGMEEDDVQKDYNIFQKMTSFINTVSDEALLNIIPHIPVENTSSEWKKAAIEWGWYVAFAAGIALLVKGGILAAAGGAAAWVIGRVLGRPGIVQRVLKSAAEWFKTTDAGRKLAGILKGAAIGAVSTYVVTKIIQRRNEIIESFKDPAKALHKDYVDGLLTGEAIEFVLSEENLVWCNDGTAIDTRSPMPCPDGSTPKPKGVGVPDRAGDETEFPMPPAGMQACRSPEPFFSGRGGVPETSFYWRPSNVPCPQQNSEKNRELFADWFNDYSSEFKLSRNESEQGEWDLESRDGKVMVFKVYKALYKENKSQKYKNNVEKNTPQTITEELKQLRQVHPAVKKLWWYDA